jgi:alkylation response protein AidB-like acyl-CoA dehydrogenase
MAQRGWFQLCVPKEHGGRFTCAQDYLQTLITLAKSDAGVALATALSNWVAEAISLYGNEAQRKLFLPRFNEPSFGGACFALTEEQAGSDVKAMNCIATPDPSTGGYLLNGHKRWITNGNLASLCIVFAKVPQLSTHGITAFIVERGTPGWEITRIVDKLGMLTVNLTCMEFKNCSIPSTHVLGNPGEGMKIALSMLDKGRMGIAAQAIGIAEAAFEASVKHAKERVQFGKPIGDNQAIAFKLADMHVSLEAAKALLWKAATLRDQHLPLTQAASTAKLFASEAANNIVNEAVQIHGGYGYIKDYPIERYLRDVRVTTIYEGTSEIQRIVISRSLLKS